MHRAILLLKKIPKGRVATYQEMARACKTSPRAIGSIMAGNKNPDEYPCYKVGASDGALTGYSGAGGLAKKQKLLERDGIRLERGRVDKRHFHSFPNPV